MAALLTTLALLAISWAVHLIWWRVRRPAHQTLGILLVFFFVPVLAGSFAGESSVLRSGDVAGMSLLYLAATACYLITYAGVDADSPSLVLIRTLQAAGEAGCSREQLARVITDDAFVAPRLHALRRDGLVAPSGSGFMLTRRGRRVARLSVILARLFGVHAGG